MDKNHAGTGREGGVPDPGAPRADASSEVERQKTSTMSDERIQVVLTIDTEPNNAWTDHRNTSVTNVRELLSLQTMLAKLGAKATCLTSSGVVRNGEATEVLQELVRSGEAEIGAHLHPWESPPFMESGIDRKYQTYPHELPLEIFEQKLGRLTESIAKQFIPPTSYRGGRWGIAPEHLSVLERMGFEVDTTVTPLIDWRETVGIPESLNGSGGIDYRSAPRHSYHPDYSDVGRKGDALIVEVPLTVAFTRRVPSFIRRAYGGLPVFVRRVLGRSGLIRPVWAMPSEETEKDLKRMLAVALDEGLPIINISIHSSELMVAGSPLSRTERDVEHILSKLESVLSILASDDRCVFTTLTQAARWWKALEASRKPTANSDGTRTLGPGA